MISRPKVLLIDCALDGSLEWAKDGLQRALPDAQVTVFPVSRAEALWEQLRRLRVARADGFDYSVLPFRRRFLKKPFYWIEMFFLLTGQVGVPRLINIDGNLLSPIATILSVLIVLQPLVSFLIILQLPVYFAHEVIGKFMLTRENAEDEFVGFGAGKGVGGLIYWLTMTKKAKRYGLFGLAQDTYMGMPLSVHSWPLAIAVLGKLGFRRYTCVSSILIGLGLAWLYVSSEHAWIVGLIPIILCSTFYIFNIYVGTWEMLPWGLGVLAFASFYNHLPVLAGVFLASTVLSHPGVSGLVLINLIGFAFADSRPLVDLMAVGATTALMTIWFIVPYLRSQDKLGRDRLINKYWGDNNLTWSPSTLYQFAIYMFFCLSMFLSGGQGNWFALAFALPLVILYYNTKIRWVFSQYTILNYMLVSGAIFLWHSSSILAILLYLLMIYASPMLLFGTAVDPLKGFDLTPVTLGETRTRVEDAFETLGAGRVAFESDGFGNDRSYNTATLGYILSDQSVELFNAGYSEIGDACIYLKYTRFLNVGASPEEFETACRESGIKYIVVYSEEFYSSLLRRGYRLRTVVDNLNLSPYVVALNSRIALFEMPWPSEFIVPDADMRISPNQMVFDAMPGQSYLLKCTAFKGWRAFQDGKQIPIIDAEPGMIVRPVNGGKVTLKYRYRHYLI